MPTHAIAMTVYLLNTLNAQVNNVFQGWDDEKDEAIYIEFDHWPSGEGCIEIEDIVLRSYDWTDYDEPGFVNRPNLSLMGVNIWWYKRPGRGMTSDVEWTAERWCAWCDRAYDYITAIGRFSTEQAKPHFAIKSGE